MSTDALNPLKKYWQNGQLKRLPNPGAVARRRQVDVRKNPHDFLACLLGSCGFSTELIARKTHLTPGQIQYRLNKGGISRKDYRNGRSMIAQRILNAAPHTVLPTLQKELTRTLNPPPEKTK